MTLFRTSIDIYKFTICVCLAAFALSSAQASPRSTPTPNRAAENSEGVLQDVYSEAFSTGFQHSLNKIIPVNKPFEPKSSYTIGFVGRSTESYEYAAASTGAYNAVKDLEKQYGIEIKLRYQTGRRRISVIQIVQLQRLLLDEVDGVIVNVLEPVMLTAQIDYLVSQGIPVVTYDEDAPESRRFATIKSNEFEMGKMVMSEYGKLTGNDKTNVAILTNNIDFELKSNRLNGAESVLANSQSINLFRVLSCSESQPAAIQLIDRTIIEDKKKKISGWAFLTYWPLFGDGKLPWGADKTVCVGVGALPPMLDYLENNEIQSLVAEAYYEWGYLSVKTMVEKIHLNKEPKDPHIYTELEYVNNDNLADYRKQWVQWTEHSKAYNPAYQTDYQIMYPHSLDESEPVIYQF